MLSFFYKINKNYGWELTLFFWLRELEDGLTFFEFILDWNRFKIDHIPSFELSLTICNLTIIDFVIYYLHHKD